MGKTFTNMLPVAMKLRDMGIGKTNFPPISWYPIKPPAVASEGMSSGVTPNDVTPNEKSGWAMALAPFTLAETGGPPGS
jgi:hypothetical protein